MKLTNEIKKALEIRAHNEQVKFGSVFYTEDRFIEDCKTYIKAVKSGRILYEVTHVSQSGNSRAIKIRSFEGSMSKGYYRNYFNMLEILGYKPSRSDRNAIRVTGCGMNMLFATNYNIIYTLYHCKMITKKIRDVLCQAVN